MFKLSQILQVLYAGEFSLYLEYLGSQILNLHVRQHINLQSTNDLNQYCICPVILDNSVFILFQ